MGCNCGCKTNTLTEEQQKILAAMAEIDGPCATKDIAAATGLESKSISCRLKSLKTKGYIASPARCRYEITAGGKSALV